MSRNAVHRLWASLAALAVLLTLSAGFGGCGSTYSKLVSEDQVPELAALKQEAAGRENHTALVRTGSGKGPPVSLAIHKLENPSTDSLIIFVHGVLADHSTWRFVAADLGRDHDLWLVDLPGCGDSDKPDPSELGDMGYGPRAVAGRILEALRDQFAARGGDGPVTLMAHSIGGSIVIRMFSDESLRKGYADVLARVDRLVLIAPLDVAVHQMDPMFKEIATASGWKIGVGAALGVVREKVAVATLESVTSPDHALREEADKRMQVLTDPARMRASQAMLTQAAAWKGTRPDWVANELVVAGYTYVRPPTMIIWGMRDETLPCSMGYKLAGELPHAEMVCIPGVKHSPHIEVPRLTAGLVREFIETGKAPALPASP